MGYTISCDLTLPEQHPAHYWWPLVFEVLRRHQFVFDSPWERPHHLGYYMLYRYNVDGTLVDADAVESASFRSLWDAIYTPSTEGPTSVSPTFWSTSPDLANWDIHCNVFEQCLSLYINSLGPGDEELAESSTALSRFVALGCDLFAECRVSTAEFNYERVGVVARFGTIGMPLALEWWVSPSKHEFYEATIDAVTLPSGSTLTIVNPFELISNNRPIPLDLPR